MDSKKVREALEAITMYCVNARLGNASKSLDTIQRCAEDTIAAIDDDGWVSWQHEAYVKLGHVRDDLPPEHVKIIQDFIGELPAPTEKDDG